MRLEAQQGERMTFLRPRVALVPPAESAELWRKVAAASFWRCVSTRKDQPLPKRNKIPRYLRAVVDEEFSGPIG